MKTINIKLPFIRVILLLSVTLLLCLPLGAQQALKEKEEEQKKALTISGYASIYYLYNFNEPTTNNQPSFIYNFHRNNEVNLNVGFLKAAYKKEKITANLAIMSGTYSQVNLAAEPAMLRSVLEANIGLRLSSKHELWLEAGIFSSHIGFESVAGEYNYTLTRSLLAENSPYYEAGIKLNYTSGDEKWNFVALFLNGWQRIKRPEGNTSPALGTQLTFKPSSTVTLNSSGFMGNDKADTAKQMRYFHNFYGIFDLGKKLSLISGFDIGIEQESKGSSKTYTWYSPVMIAKYNAAPRVTIAARAEYYSDQNAVILSPVRGSGFSMFGFSANLDYSFSKEVCWRTEVRLLKSQDAVFEAGNSKINSSVTWITTTLTAGF